MASIEKIPFEFSNNIQSVDGTSKTAIEMVGKVIAKTNECVELVNGVSQIAAEATAIVDEMHDTQADFVTATNDAQNQLISDNQAYIDDLTEDKTTFETNMNNALTSFETGLNSSKTTFETNMTTAVNTIIANAEATIDEDISNHVDALITDGTIADMIDVAIAPKAPLESPGLTGTPTAPTAAIDENTTQIATTAFVKAATDKAKIVFNVKDYGAKGDGVTDDTAAFNSALTAAGLVGGTVYIPPVSVGYVIAGAVVMPTKTSLLGTFNYPTRSSEVAATTGFSGSTLLMTTTSSQITMKCGTTVSGLIFYWPNQTNTNPPVAYPAAIKLSSIAGVYDYHINNCLIINAYNFLDAATIHGRLVVENIWGWALSNFISADAAWDVDRFINIHINPGYWWCWQAGGSPTDTPSYTWAKANLIGMNIGALDSVIIDNYLQFGGNYGIKFFKGVIPGNTWSPYGQFSNLSFDTVTTPINVADFTPGGGLLFNNLTCAAALHDIYVTADEPNGVIHINNYESFASTSATIVHNGNCSIFINNANIEIGNISNLIYFGTTINNAKSIVHITDGNFRGGPGNDVVRAITATPTGVIMDVSFSNCKYVAGGVLPAVSPLTAYGTLKLRCENAPPVGYLAAQLAPAITAVANTIGVDVRVFVTNGSTAQTVKINGTVAATLPASGACAFLLAPDDTIAMGTSTTGVTWASFGL